jgi:hypothetical protein|tara:strand:+ start:86 stop:691 length:606 start_codon:yes stop_codon:yes gene_type:complete
MICILQKQKNTMTMKSITTIATCQLFLSFLLLDLECVETTKARRQRLRSKATKWPVRFHPLRIPARDASSDDLIRSGTILELGKHGIQMNDINNMLFDAPANSAVAPLALTSLRPQESSLSLSSSSSWLQDACKFVKERNVVEMPTICRQRFPGIKTFSALTSEQKRQCHKLLWKCIAATDNPMSKELCKEKHTKCMENGK